MKHPLLSLALTCLYLLHASALVNVQPDFDITKFAGKWNLIAMAMKEGQPSDVNRIHTTVVSDNDGVIAFKTRVPVGKECKRLQTRFFPDEQPGIYRTDLGKTTIYIMKTDYVRYAILFIYTKEMEVLHLYGAGNPR
ncbi:lipocalin-15-like [Lacerta agilis]|uniref:lipocalin-15-like n=1 Tax=Lacerta agilis TaxID=80427 RepID=UPI001419236E|nr:lipocalin-15-like [Lacerta agilis]